MAHEGTVKFFNSAKGYGFIIKDVTNEEVFVHATGIKDGYKIKEKDRVKFEEEDGKKGICAVKVEIVF